MKQNIRDNHITQPGNDWAWWKETIVYQIYPRSFKDSNDDGIGDLNGITEKLDYLHGLGIETLWLNPIFASPNADNGYDISDYRQIMPDFGTMEDFDRLLNEAHARGMRLLLDLVLNHTSDQHPWFREARMSLPPLTNGVYIGVRRPDGSVLKDRLFLLSGRDWTRMALDFDSGEEQELTVFCGVWTDRNSTYFVDDFSLNMIK